MIIFRGGRIPPLFLTMIKKDLTLYLVTQSGQQYKLPIYEDVRYSQTFSEEEIQYKTLHNPELLIRGGFTTKYNAGDFEFTIPVMDSIVMRALFTIFFKNIPENFILYYVENGISIRLNTCIATRITFNFGKNALITATIAGEYSNSEEAAITGTSEGSLGDLYTHIEGIGITLNSLPVTNITEFSLEMANQISWVENNYMHNTGPSYPTEYYCSEKVISGTFTRNEDLNQPTYVDSAPLLVQIKSNNEIFLEFDFDSVISTTRPQLDMVIKKGYDFRVNNIGNEVRYKGVNIL